MTLIIGLMLCTWLALPVAVCIAIRGRYTRLAWLANPNTNPDLNPNPNPTNLSYGKPCVYTASHVYRHFLMIAGIETEEVGWGRGGIMLTIIKSLDLCPSIIQLLCSALTASHRARWLQCLRQTNMSIFCAVNV